MQSDISEFIGWHERIFNSNPDSVARRPGVSYKCPAVGLPTHRRSYCFINIPLTAGSSEPFQSSLEIKGILRACLRSSDNEPCRQPRSNRDKNQDQTLHRARGQVLQCPCSKCMIQPHLGFSSRVKAGPIILANKLSPEVSDSVNSLWLLL